MNYLFLLVALVLLAKYSKGAVKTLPSVYNIDITQYTFKNQSLELTTKQKQEFIYVREFVNNLLSKYSANIYNIPLNVVSAIVYQESVLQILQGLPNEKVFGYDGKSIGYFQVTKFPVIDYNLVNDTDYTYADCYQEKINVIIGMFYLNLCYKNNTENVFLTAKKYNGGVDETQNSSNTMATTHGKKVEKWYNIFKSITEN